MPRLTSHREISCRPTLACPSAARTSALIPPECGRPLLEECTDALLEVLGLRCGGLELGLPFELLLQRGSEGVVDQALRHPDAARRQCGQLVGDLGDASRE